MTVSPRPSAVATPMRSIAPSRTCATWPTVTGVPFALAVSTIFSMSAKELISPFAAQDVLLAVVLDVSAARVHAAPLDRREDVLERQAIRYELGGVDDDLVLLRQPAPGVDSR
jgi:hypothetical protein